MFYFIFDSFERINTKFGRMINSKYQFFISYHVGSRLLHVDWFPSPPLATVCNVLLSSGLNFRIIFNTGTKCARSSALFIVKNCKIIEKCDYSSFVSLPFNCFCSCDSWLTLKITFFIYSKFCICFSRSVDRSCLRSSSFSIAFISVNRATSISASDSKDDKCFTLKINEYWC